MDVIPVESSSLKSVGYDELTQTLTVEFHTGKKYSYGEVPVEVYNDLLEAKSAGSYFAKNIRGKYEPR
jgi:hypothetical protein